MFLVSALVNDVASDIEGLSFSLFFQIKETKSSFPNLEIRKLI